MLTATHLFLLLNLKPHQKYFLLEKTGEWKRGGSVRLLTPLKCTNIVGQIVGANCRDSCGLGTHNSQS